MYPADRLGRGRFFAPGGQVRNKTVMAHRSPSKAPSQRQLRVGEMLRHALSEILSRGEVQDPDLEGVLVTVSEVRVSPDLRHATAFVVGHGGGGTDGAVRGLGRSSRFLRGELGRRIRIKFTPELHFRADESFDTASHLEEVLRSDRVRKDIAPQTDTDDDLDGANPDETGPDKAGPDEAGPGQDRETLSGGQG